MKFTEDFNNYIRNLSPEDRERELERVGYYAAGHGRPRRPGRTSVQGFPTPPRHSDPFSYTESMGSSMVNEAGAGFQDMASGGSAYMSPSVSPTTGQQMPIQEFRNDKKQALKSGMQRFGMSEDALRNIAKTVGIRRLDSSNDLKMIQDHFDKQKPKDKGPGNRGISTVDVFGPGRVTRGGGMMGDRDFYSPGRNPGNYGGGRYGEFYSDLPDNTGHGGGSSYGSDSYGSDSYGSDSYGSDSYGSDRYGSNGYGQQRGLRPVMSPEQLGIAGYGRPNKKKGNGQQGISTQDVFGGRRRGARDRARSYIK